MKMFKKLWKSIKRFFRWLWRVISRRRKDVDSFEAVEIEERITDKDGKTPRTDETLDIDKLFSGLPPEAKEKLRRDYELRNRKPVLVPVVRSVSSPAEIQTSREIVRDEMPVLEEAKEREENRKSDL